VVRTAEGWACAAPDSGPKGQEGAAGNTGLEGQGVALSSLAFGDAHCPYGGAKVTTAAGDAYVCNGATGERGDSGVQGAKGDTGSEGNQGNQGDSAIVAALDTGDPHCFGGGIKVTLGAVEHFVCNGTTGVKGDTGPQGPQGGTGLQGTQGNPGDSVAGVSLGTGDARCPHGGTLFTVGGVETVACDGAPGATGDTGADGPKGDTGSPGIRGDPGSSVLGESIDVGDPNCVFGGIRFTIGMLDRYVCNGAPGAVGDTGAQGSKGNVGPEGMQGIPGLSVAGRSLAPGEDSSCPAGGSEFTIGEDESYACSGASGAKGDTGPQGARGNTGLQGIQGNPGQSVSAVTLTNGNADCAYGGSRFAVAGVSTFACNGAPGIDTPSEANWSGIPLSIPHGGTGATTAAAARAALGLGTMAVQDAASANIAGGTVNATHTGDGSGLTGVVAAYIRSDTSGACGSGQAGQARYNNGRFEGCNGSAWKLLDNGAAPCPAGYALIPAGTFTMGSPTSEPWRDSGETQHEVTITRPFCTKSTEVTQAEWQGLLGNNPSSFPSCGGTCPVETVSWWDALNYANALSNAQGLHACYTLQMCTGTVGQDHSCAGATFVGVDCAGYRLPTEAEWEYAARAGTKGRTYNGTLAQSDCAPNAILDPIAWFGGNSCSTPPAASCSGGSGCGPHPVRVKQANPWGLFDMLGNVWEWCWDLPEPYSTASAVDPTGATSGSGRVNRGGSWGNGSDSSNVRAAHRNTNVPEYRIRYLGFRLVRSAQ